MDTTRRTRTTLLRVSSFVATVISLSSGVEAQTGEGFVLTAYPDAVGGERLLSGHYSAALKQIRGTKPGTASAEVVKSTNACVAYTALRKLTEARAACDAAVAAATLDRSHTAGIVSKSRTDEDSSVAIAYTNRAIMHSLSHQAVSTAEDLAEAHSLAPQSEYVARNIAAFKQAPGTLAHLEIVAQRMED